MLVLIEKNTINSRQKEMESPIKYFAAMDDFRQIGKVKHKLENIIAITIAAVICGCENWYEIEDYGKQKEPWLKTFLD